MAVAEKVKSIIVEQLGVDAEEVTPAATPSRSRNSIRTRAWTGSSSTTSTRTPWPSGAGMLV